MEDNNSNNDNNKNNIKLIKGKVYCNSCYKNNIITELTIDEHDSNFYLEPECGHKGRYFSYLKQCEKCQDFTSHRGLKIIAECYRCVMKKNCNTALDNGCHSCQNSETSLANP